MSFWFRWYISDARPCPERATCVFFFNLKNDSTIINNANSSGILCISLSLCLSLIPDCICDFEFSQNVFFAFSKSRVIYFPKNGFLKIAFSSFDSVQFVFTRTRRLNDMRWWRLVDRWTACRVLQLVWKMRSTERINLVDVILVHAASHRRSSRMCMAA